jgi:hypothetical protein
MGTKLHTRIPGPNPTIVSYNASAVKLYNATGSLLRFENNFFSSTLKNTLAYYNTGVVAVNLKVAGLAPVYTLLGATVEVVESGSCA